MINVFLSGGSGWWREALSRTWQAQCRPASCTLFLAQCITEEINWSHATKKGLCLTSDSIKDSYWAESNAIKGQTDQKCQKRDLVQSTSWWREPWHSWHCVHSFPKSASSSETASSCTLISTQKFHGQATRDSSSTSYVEKAQAQALHTVCYCLAVKLSFSSFAMWAQSFVWATS